MSTQSRVDGFTVLVHDGREITEAQASQLRRESHKLPIVEKVNGPHHSAKWAVDRKNRRCQQHGFSLPFNASNRVLKTVFNKN